MANDRVSRALSRIEAAVDRIEAQIEQPADEADGLAERHARLRAQTAAALARIDQLLGSAG